MTRLSKAPDKIEIGCSHCHRHGRYDRDQALQKYGDIEEMDFLFRVVSASCALKKHPKIGTACKARLVAPTRRAA